MRRRMLFGLIALTVLMPLRVAHADGSWGLLFPSVSLVSEYRYDGVSSSDRRPTLQGVVHWWRPDGFYAGIFTSGVDYNDPGDTRLEVDFYGGKNIDFDDTRLTLSALYAIFPDNATPGPTYDFFQSKVAVRHTFGALALGGSTAWTPEASYGSGTAWRLASEASYSLTPWISLSGNLGQRWIERGYDRVFWDVGLTLKWNRVEFDLRYVDTNLSRGECFFTDWCEPAVVGKISFNGWD